MKQRHQPDHEFEVMRKMLSYLLQLSPAGRRRSMDYIAARLADMPSDGVERHGEQQLDLEERMRNNGAHASVA